MKLRESHDHPWAFDTFLIGLAIFGAFVMWWSFAAGGFWIVLGVLAWIGECLLMWGVWIEPRRLTVARYREPLVPDPKTWIKVVWLSDLHVGGFHSPAWYERIVRETQALNPDIVVLGGDFIVYQNDPMHELDVLKEVKGRLGNYFVLGNHDLLDRPEELRTHLESLGFKDLTNRATRMERDGAALDISGVDDPWYGEPVLTPRPSKQIPHLLLSHEPDILLDLKEGDADLVLAGHTHGGQVRLPFIGPLWPIPAKLGKAVDRGRKIVNGTPCIISNGLGETDGRLRVGSPPQIVCVDVGI
jgi:uncharacterized protein